MRLITLLSWMILLVVALDYLYPIKLFTVLLHEYSHAIVAVATGGKVVELTVSPDLTGHVKSVGGSRFLTLTAGYLGSLIFGALIFYWAYVRRHPTSVYYMLSIVIVIGMIVFQPTMMAASISLIVLGVLYPVIHKLPKWGGVILGSIGLSSMLYAIRDIYSHTIIHPGLQSDAHMLAKEIGGTTQMWGALWLCISLAVLVYLVKCSVQHARRVENAKNNTLNSLKAAHSKTYR